MSIVGTLDGLFNLEPWVDQALCAQVGDTDLWYPEKLRGAAATKDAKAVCRRCPVVEECLEYALRRGESHGVWGGRSAKERQRMKRGLRWSPTTHCLRDHAFAEVGRRADGSCVQCRREQNRKHRGVA